MTIEADIKELPEWPPLPVQYGSNMEPYKSNALLRHVMAERDAALAYLALARKWMDDAPHHDECDKARWSEDGTYSVSHDPCTCGRDALLAAMEPPK